MCLGVPGKIVDWIEHEGLFARAEIEFGGIRRVCHMACTTGCAVGDYVIVHAGIAISRIDEQQANRIFEELDRLGDDEGWSKSE